MRLARFNDYREIAAKYAGKSTACGSKVGGHDIDVGDLIGYSAFGYRTDRIGVKALTICANCWQSWCWEISAAQALERSGL